MKPSAIYQSAMLVCTVVLSSCGGEDKVVDNGKDHGGGSVLQFPFATKEGHGTTDTPDGHAARGVSDRNWDVDCVRGEDILSPVTGHVYEEPMDCKLRGLKDSPPSYGNYVCIQTTNEDRYYLNHMEAGTIVVKAGEAISAGQVIGKCGVSGTVIAIGDGDGSHVDIFAKNAADKAVELANPADWPVGDVIEAKSAPTGKCCPSGSGKYCGDPDKDMRPDEGTLYSCEGNNIWTPIEVCSGSCFVAAPGTNDYCE